MTLPVFQAGNAVQFTWVSTLAPNSAPIFALYENNTDTVVSTMTAISSDTTHYYALGQLPGSEQWMTAEWTAEKTIGSSVWTFVNRFAFAVKDGRPSAN